MKKAGSVPKDSEQPFMTARPSMRISVHVTTTVVAIVPVRVKVVTNLVRVVISPVRVATSVREAISARDRKAAISPVRATSLVRAVISVRDRMENTEDSLVRVISPVKDRVAISVPAGTNRIRSLMASPAVPIRKVPANIQPTMIRMPSIA